MTGSQLKVVVYREYYQDLINLLLGPLSTFPEDVIKIC